MNTAQLQLEIQGRLTSIDGGLVDINIMELKSEGIVRHFWEAIINRGHGDAQLPWDGRTRWDPVDMILLKVASYMVFHKMTWLCWTAASHLIVFRLVHHPPQKPYLVISDVVQVDDTRKPDPDPVDKRIAHSQGKFHFHVEDHTSVIGDPNPTPEEQKLKALSDSIMSAAGTSSGSNWTPQSGRQRSPYIDTEQCDQAGLPYNYQKMEDILSSTIPWLNVNGFLGCGSTGEVFSGSWQGKDVAVKIAESKKARVRLRLESVWYARIAEREPAKDILPTFFGWFRHSFFDMLVLSNEGSALDSWNDLLPDERLELFSMALKLHQAGICHRDLEPRNVLHSITGQLKLVDLSEAVSEHQCCGIVAVKSVINHTS
ncbi:hypothetical protein JB92DRAFT_3303961 [Gautieria morchelliformis]|nr:hypothetical protein JB92DRAFT_3303961 [Gautieria morchelliformis]